MVDFLEDCDGSMVEPAVGFDRDIAQCFAGVFLIPIWRAAVEFRRVPELESEVF